MATTGEALMQAILDTPDNDGPRLVYADWLEEHGEPERAQFIRVQCELARLENDAPSRQSLVKRQEDLENAYWTFWTRGLGIEFLHSEFRRGFLEVVGFCTDDFPQHPHTSVEHAGRFAALTFAAKTLLLRLESICRSHPVREVVVTPRGDWGDEAVVIDAAGANILADSARLASMNAIDLRYNTVESSARGVLQARFGDRVFFED